MNDLQIIPITKGQKPLSASCSSDYDPARCIANKGKLRKLPTNSLGLFAMPSPKALMLIGRGRFYFMSIVYCAP